MRIKSAQSEVDQYGYKRLSSEANKRLDLRDLIQRNTDEKNKNKKINVLIFCGATCLVTTFIFLSSF